MAKAGIVMIPTLTVHADFVNFLFDPTVLDAPLTKELAPEALISAYRHADLITNYKDKQAKFRERNAVTFSSVNAMINVGVRILVGTDSGNWNTIQGYSVHREMKLLTEAGMTPHQAIASATTYSANFLGIKSGFNEGDKANPKRRGQVLEKKGSGFDLTPLAMQKSMAVMDRWARFLKTVTGLKAGAPDGKFFLIINNRFCWWVRNALSTGLNRHYH